MKKLFLDTNILLDILLRREPFYGQAAKLWLRIESGELQGMVSLVSLGTLFYLIRKNSDAGKAREALQIISKVMRIADAPEEAGHMALRSHMADFEDALQYAIATLAGADCIITRNTSDFPKHGKLPVLTPLEFLNRP